MTELRHLKRPAPLSRRRQSDPLLRVTLDRIHNRARTIAVLESENRLDYIAAHRAGAGLRTIAKAAGISAQAVSNRIKACS